MWKCTKTARTCGTLSATPDAMTGPAPQLKKGDRVQLIHPIVGVAVGTRGMVLRCFAFDPLYDVFFDGYPSPRLVNKGDLAAVPSARTDIAPSA